VSGGDQLSRLSPSVYLHRDICNVYVVVRNGRALLVDFGSGSVLGGLSSVGAERIDWVLHTHHHRDQCQGDWLLGGSFAQIAAPESEVRFFTHAEQFWQDLDVYDTYDCSNVYSNAGYNIDISKALPDYSVFEWEGIDFTVLPTPGHTRGSITFVTEIDEIRYGFTGDLICAPGRVWTLHDLVWRYGYAEGARVSLRSVWSLRRAEPSRLAPSHGDVIDQPRTALELLETNLTNYLSWSDRGYRTRRSTRPDGELTQLSEHLIAVTGTSSNFYVLRGNDGGSLFFDYGFASEEHMSANYRFVEHSLAELESRFGIEPPAVVVPTHYHDDHVSGLSFLQTVYGAEIWVFEHFADIIERPYAYRIPCLWSKPSKVTRVLRDRERFGWGGHEFEVRHCPGHTWFAAAFFGEIDGVSVAVTGDAVKWAADGSLWGGSPTFRNRVGVADFVTSIDTIREYEPNLLLTGHWGPIQVSEGDLDAYRRWAEGLAKSIRAIVSTPASVGFAIDPDFVRVIPYESMGFAGSDFMVEVEVWNHFGHYAFAAIRLVTPTSWRTEPEVHQRDLEGGVVARFRFRVFIPDSAKVGSRQLVFADVVLGERLFGQVAEGLVMVKEAAGGSDSGLRADRSTSSRR
jgi:glyoxylase-like metal-dependent hydrolase (beta-lactamase superfamily II)